MSGNAIQYTVAEICSKNTENDSKTNHIFSTLRPNIFWRVVTNMIWGFHGEEWLDICLGQDTV